MDPELLKQIAQLMVDRARERAIELSILERIQKAQEEHIEAFLYLEELKEVIYRYVTNNR